MTKSVLQDWVLDLPLMQQSVLLTVVRGPDNSPKYSASKLIVRWARRAFLKSSFLGRPLYTPYEKDGGSFYGPSCAEPDGPMRETRDATWEMLMAPVVNKYIQSLDEVPHYFQMHMMHAAEIIGYKHPDERIKFWWHSFYIRLAHDLHLLPETSKMMNSRLSDNRESWLERADKATVD